MLRGPAERRRADVGQSRARGAYVVVTIDRRGRPGVDPPGPAGGLPYRDRPCAAGRRRGGGKSQDQRIQSVALGGYILLFAFTYLWVAINQYVGLDGRGLGWYSLFVAITALPTGLLLLADTGGNPWLVWLGLDWLAWAVLWFLFFVLLALQRPIARFTGYVAAIEGILTAWPPSWLLFQGYPTL